MVNNILIIGITGNGKSALANTLAKTDKFGESSSSTSATKDSQKSEIFLWKEKEYCVIDNIGFGDNRNISEEDILLKIGEGIHSAKEGINQVLFVFDGRFSDDHIMAFNLFKKFISESKITDYTTLVRTKFTNFKDEDECRRDKESLLNQKKELREIISSCKGGIIYVDNPSIPKMEESSEDSESDEEMKTMKREMKEIEKREVERNNERKKDSRKTILDHLANICQDPYKLENWDTISLIVGNYIKEKESIEKNNSLDKAKKEELQKELNNKAAKNIKEHLETKLAAEINKAAVVIEHYTKNK